MFEHPHRGLAKAPALDRTQSQAAEEEVVLRILIGGQKLVDKLVWKVRLEFLRRSGRASRCALLALFRGTLFPLFACAVFRNRGFDSIAIRQSLYDSVAKDGHLLISATCRRQIAILRGSIA